MKFGEVHFEGDQDCLTLKRKTFKRRLFNENELFIQLEKTGRQNHKKLFFLFVVLKHKCFRYFLLFFTVKTPAERKHNKNEEHYYHIHIFT